MARFLFVVPPFTGHVNPTIPVAATLMDRGHDVAWTGLPGLVDPLLPIGSAFFPATSAEVADYVAGAGERRPDLRGAAAFKFLQEEVLLPLAEAMVDGVDAAVDAFNPDVLVVDQQALAGAVVARRRGLPWATSATTSAELVDPLSGLPLVAAEMHARRVELQLKHGIPEELAGQGDLRVSEHLVLAYTTQTLVGPPTIDSPVCFVGPATVGRPEADDFPWELLHPELPTVLVSLGTLNADAGARFWQVAADACRDQPWQAVFVAPAELVPDPPANVLVRTRVPQLSLLRRVDAVVSTPVTTPCASRWRRGCRWCWHPSGTTSRWWPSRWWPPARGSASGSPGCAPRSCARRSSGCSASPTWGRPRDASRRRSRRPAGPGPRPTRWSGWPRAAPDVSERTPHSRRDTFAASSSGIGS